MTKLRSLLKIKNYLLAGTGVNQVLGKHIFIACMPKSGSTFLSNTLAEITGFDLVDFRLKPIDNLVEQEVSLTALEQNKSRNTVTQQHTRGSIGNFNNLKDFDAIIFVQTRNIFDVVMSTYDHIENLKKAGSTMAYANEEYFNLSKELRFKMIIDLVIPWHIHFYVSWYDRLQKENYPKIKWVSYEELTQDEPGYIKSLLEFCEISNTQEQIKASIKTIKASKKKARLNIGQAGRGKELSEAQRNRIISYTEFYPWVDFSRIGI